MDAPRAGPEALTRLTETIRQLRGVPHLRERQPGLFVLQGKPFVELCEDRAGLFALLGKAGGSGTERFPLDDAPECRRLVDETKRRAAKVTDE